MNDLYYSIQIQFSFEKYSTHSERSITINAPSYVKALHFAGLYFLFIM